MYVSVRGLSLGSYMAPGPQSSYAYEALSLLLIQVRTLENPRLSEVSRFSSSALRSSRWMRASPCFLL